MSIISNWFKQESTKVILKAALSILKIFAGQVANDIWKRTTDAAVRAENSTLSGPEKAKYVGDELRRQWPEIKSHLVNLATELAVAYLREGLLKR